MNFFVKFLALYSEIGLGKGKISKSAKARFNSANCAEEI
jgi:hypothetical protein